MASAIDDATLTEMRALVKALAMPSRCTIERPGTPVPDGQGGETVPWVSVATVACRVRPTTGQERRLGERVVALGEWVFTLPYGTDVTARDRLVYRDTVYEVAWTPPDIYSYQVSVQVIGRRGD
jgi:SPP1 family predicted phage head-tail adaptor